MDFYFDDIFQVKEVDPDGKKFDKVSRIKAKSENYGMDLILDINSELYPLKLNEKFNFILSPTLSLDGSMDDGTFDYSKKETLADRYEYVMYGKVYKFDEASSSKLAVYISFGGLLMKLEGEARHVSSIKIGSNIYLLMKKA